MNAETVDNVGTPQLKQLNTVNIEMFRHPNYYKELRRRNREVLRSGRGLAVNQAPHVSDQAISHSASTEANSRRAPDPGHKPQASSHKRQAP